MVRDSQGLDKKFTEGILNFCRHIAHSRQVTATCICGDYALDLPDVKTALQVLVIIRDFQPRLMNYAKVLDGHNIAFIAVDEWVFERDVDRGFLGEALASGLIFPYAPLIGKDYLRFQEIKLKKRLIIELMESLVMDFPELSYDFYIKPEYFMYEAMLTRARLYPPMLYALATLMQENRKEKNVENVLSGFLEALKELEGERVISSSTEYIKISKEFADTVKGRRVRFTNLFRTGQRTLFTSLLGIFPQILNVFSQNKEVIFNLQKIFEESSKALGAIEDPEYYVYVPTVSGLAPLANRMDIQAFARKVLSADKDAEVKIKNIGGILNDVYLVRTTVKGNEKKAVVKRFRDWSNFKWFPLTLWSVGTRTFAVFAISRLERECAINRLLDSKGFPVPKVLYVSPAERLIFMEYIEGQDLSKLIKKITNTKSAGEVEKGLSTIGKIGELFACVHGLGVALGDTKPENFMVEKSGEICMMDFEQASRNGDRVWDVAEFLYYAGHDIPPFTETNRVEQIGNAFIMGYLKRGGNVKIVKDAGNPKYTKVFSVFTFPHIMFTLSNICRRADKLGK